METPELGKFTWIGHGGTNAASGFGAGMWLYPELGVMLVYTENVQKPGEGTGIALTVLETLSEINRLNQDK
mgnify:FL=1